MLAERLGSSLFVSIFDFRCINDIVTGPEVQKMMNKIRDPKIAKRKPARTALAV